MKGFAKRFTNRWGKLPQLQLPCSIVQNKTICLDPSALKALTILHHVYKATKKFQPGEEVHAIAKVGQGKLIERTGYSRSTISRALKSLRKAGYIATIADRKLKKKNGSSVARYILLRPDTREPLFKSAKGNILYANKLPYFTVPVCI